MIYTIRWLDMGDMQHAVMPVVFLVKNRQLVSLNMDLWGVC